MNPEQRRAHLILHGQTLLDAWTERCRLYDEGFRLQDEGSRLHDEGNKLCAWPGVRRIEGHTLRIAGNKLYAEGTELQKEGATLFDDAVRAEFGDMSIYVSEDGSCTLGNGEVYRYGP